MITITPPKKSKSRWIAAAVAGSFFVHGILFAAGTKYAANKEQSHYAPSRIEFTTPPSPPEPPPQEELPLEKIPEKIVPPEPVKRLPRPNRQQPVLSPEEPPKPVFGATDASVGNSDSSVAIRVGNTLEKTMEKEAPPKKVTPLPPAEEKTSAPPIATEKEIKPVPVYSLSSAPTFKRKVEPIYPMEAKQAAVEGVVQLEVLIDATGRVRHIKVLQTPGQGLEKAAIRALTQSLFTPGMVNGNAVPVRIKIPYRFILDP